MSDKGAPPQTRLDRAIAAFAPGWAVSRAQARLALDSIRAYEAASTGRRTSGWNAPSTGANLELATGFDRVRARARDMVRNNEYAASAVRRMTTALVGTGIQISPADKAEREAFLAWANSTEPDPARRLNLAGIIRLAVRSWREGGEALIRRRTRRAADGLSVPLQLQLLEGDHIDSSRLAADATGFTLLGIKHDPIGGRTGYWLFSEHPGENWPLRSSLTSALVPATEVIHLFDAERIGQVRGMSSLGVGLLRLRDVADFELAVQLRKKVEACFSAFVHTDDPAMSVAGVSLDPNDQSAGRRRDKLAPGIITYLKGGESVTFGAPPTSTNEDAFTAQQLRAFAAGVGIPYEVLTGDLSKTNFSSNRLGLIEYRLLIEELQWLVLVPQVIAPIRQWWREAYQAAGGRVGKKPDRITMPRRPWVKPTEDVAAAKEAERAGYTTKGEVLREQGYASIDEYIEERTEEVAKLKAAGLATDTDPGTSASGATTDPKAKGGAAASDQTSDDKADPAP